VQPVNPTLSLAQAAQCPWPAVVVGAGPAGALIAGLLARAGQNVLLVDQAHFPRAKVCGSCLNGRALAALADAGLADLPSRCGAAPLHHFHLGAPGSQARMSLPTGLALSRERFDAALIRAACERGSHFLPGTRATLLPDDSDSPYRSLLLRGPEGEVQVQSAVVLAADGLAGTLQQRTRPPTRPETDSRIGAGVVLPCSDPFYEPGTIYMACGSGGYVGLVRVEDGRLDVASAADPAELRQHGGPGRLAVDLLTRVGWPVPEGLAEAGWRGTPALTRQAQQVAAHRLFALGDATGYVEPFTGEGMAWALSSAVALAPLALQACHRWDTGLAKNWTERHHRIVASRRRTCRLAAAVLRRPLLTGLVVRLLAWLPSLARPVVAGLNRPARVFSVSSGVSLPGESR